MTSTGSAARLLDPGYRFIFFKFLEEHGMEYMSVFNTMDTERAYEEDIVFAGLGAVPEKSEGSNVFFDDPIQGNVVRYTPIEFGLGFRVTEIMLEDDLYGIMNKVVQCLARSARHTIETIAWDVLNFAFDATRPGQDNVALCHTAHPLLGGGTQANRPTVDGDFNATTMQAAIDTFERMVDHRGLPIAMSAQRIIIPPELKWKVRVALNSAMVPGSTNNDINALKEEGLNYFIGHFLLSPTAWFVDAGQGTHDLRFYNRRGVRFRSADDFDSGDSKHKVDFRCVAGFTSFYGFYGNAGA
jgi:hypothetical protein